jgi:hypothetical protein
VRKNHHEMSFAERMAARIAQNREIEQRLTQEPSNLLLCGLWIGSVRGNSGLPMVPLPTS